MKIRNLIVAVPAIAVTVAVAACSSSEGSSQAADTTTTTTVARATTTTTTAVAAGVIFKCSQKEGTGSKKYGLEVTLPRRTDGVLDYGSAWAGEYSGCETTTTIGPTTDLEKQVYDMYGSPKGLGYAYASCTQNDSDDVFSRPGQIPSQAQIPERSAALALCPDHPFAERWARGLHLAQPGNSFRDGTHVVGTDVQPGTYAIDAPIDGCYWERQDNAGKTIDNNFINSAARVEVTISASDYGFVSKRCGTWISVTA